LSIGTAKRDYATLIAAVSQLPGYRTNIGASSIFGDAYTGHFQKEMPDWVHFVEGVSGEQLVLRYQAARFVVVPLVASAHSGAGASVALEASACGKAVIATRTAGMPSFVQDGKTGILVPPNDIGAMREAIRMLYSNPALADEMGKAGRAYVESEFETEKVYARIGAVIQQVYRDYSK
jgi:glycosyltransferase involved in cell wall biosynthesis